MTRTAKNKWYRGFTLIELLLAIAILGTMSVVSYSGFQTYNKDKDLGVATADFVNTLNEAKVGALTQVRASYCTGQVPSKTFLGYRVLVDNSATPDRYVLQIVCSGQLYSPIHAYESLPGSVALNIKKVTYDASGATVLVAAPNNEIFFQAPEAKLDASIAATLNAKTIEGVGIDENGVISQCDAKCDPGY